MPRLAISVQNLNRTAGTVPTYGAAQAPGSGSNMFANDGRTFIHIKNGGASPITATFVTPGNVAGLAIADQVVTVTNGTEKMVGPFEPGLFNQSDGTVHVDWSDVTSVTVGVMRV
jgi:hypothetical protein